MTIFKEHIYNEDTGLYSTVDNRNFQLCVEFSLNEIRQKAKDLILEAAPEHKQRNAALGLLPAEETNQIKDDIQSIRTISNQKENDILGVVWDGQESTRIAACDAVQNIRWD